MSSYSERRKALDKRRRERERLIYRQTGESPKREQPSLDQKRHQKYGKRWDAIILRIPKQDHVVGAEVGVWRGETCSKVLARCPNVTLYLIDRWKPPKKGDSYSRSGAKIAAKSIKEHKEAFDLTMSLIKPYEDRAIVLKGDTVPMAKKIEDGILDFAFIDADHSFEGVYNDILAYLPKIKVGGWIGGHDYNGKWEVEDAVHTFFDKRRVTKDVNSTWFVRVTEEDIDNRNKIVEEMTITMKMEKESMIGSEEIDETVGKPVSTEDDENPNSNESETDITIPDESGNENDVIVEGIEEETKEKSENDE